MTDGGREVTRLYPVLDVLHGGEFTFEQRQALVGLLYAVDCVLDLQDPGVVSRALGERYQALLDALTPDEPGDPTAGSAP